MKKLDKILLGDDDLKSCIIIQKILEEMNLGEEMISQFKGIHTLAFVIVNMVKNILLPELGSLETQLISKIKSHPALSALVKRIVAFRFSSTVFGMDKADHPGANVYLSPFFTRQSLLTHLEHSQN